jgi:prepilin-type N-terminal cleavage/methylation domain-containing protein
MKNRRSAFTLIELLVVIAIIAILAAILFPVFAQAKAAAKKSVEVSNVKQELLSVAIYINDVDDTYPMAYGVRPAATWGSGVLHPVPYNVITTSPWTQSARWLMAQCFWENATYPYSKNFGIESCPVSINETLVQALPADGADTYLAGVPLTYNGLTYNGLFHQMNATSLPAPANAVEFWEDQNVNFIGRGASSPAENCVALGAGTSQGNPPAGCIFNSGDTGAGTGGYNQGIYYIVSTTNPAWIFNNRMVVGYADDHAKTGFVGLTIAPAVAAPSGSINDPLAQVSTTGFPNSYWPCGQGGPTDLGSTAVYPCYFRPDRTW